jgi:lipopolysaccharide transport system ATP-binding protein
MIQLDRVTKAYRIYRRKSDWLKERVLRRPLHERKVALNDVSLSVGEGEVLGVIGRNGAGKSTLLKLIMGVALPDSGALRVDGRVTGLLELGTGFNPDLSGNENIDFNAALLGMTPREIAEKRDAIIAFSELGEAINDPMRTYSSGMTMRLAFAIGIHAEPACFVVDEALSVGDIHFQQKCMRRIRAFKANGGAIVFVSHDVNAVKILCDRAAVLERGAVVSLADPDTAANHYNRIIADMDPGAPPVVAGADPPAPAMPADDGDASEAATAPLDGHADADLGALVHPGNRATGYGSGDVTIQAVWVRGAESGSAVVASGETATIAVRARAARAVADATLGLMIRDRFGQDVFGTNTYKLGHPIALDAGQVATFRFRMPMNLGPGQYSLTLALHREDDHLSTCYHWCDNVGAFEVAGFRGPPFQGICRLEPRFTADVAEPAEHD